jgi:hypothetical protein
MVESFYFLILNACYLFCSLKSDALLKGCVGDSGLQSDRKC